MFANVNVLVQLNESRHLVHLNKLDYPMACYPANHLVCQCSNVYTLLSVIAFKFVTRFVLLKLMSLSSFLCMYDIAGFKTQVRPLQHTDLCCFLG